MVAGILVAAGGCGPKSEGDASTLKIRNGAVVAPSAGGPERVSTVGIVARKANGGTYICSAALVGPKLLATAGHCVVAGATLKAFFGTDVDAVDAAAQLVSISSSLVHDGYRAVTGDLPPHDIALLTLARNAPASAKVIPLLPDDATIEAGSTVRLAGFGITQIGGDSGRLRYVDTTYVGEDAQQRLLIQDGLRRGACSGDSGGPLFVKHAGGWHVAGVLSGGPIPCRGINVYTSLRAYREFVTAGS